MVAFVFRAPAGVAGDVTRPDDTVVEPAFINPENAPTAFGVAVAMVNGRIEKLADGVTPYGVLTRVAPSIAGDIAQAFEDGTPNPAAPQGVAVQGYVNVLCLAGDPVRGEVATINLDESAGAVGAFTTGGGSGSAKMTWAVAGKDENDLGEIRIF